MDGICKRPECGGKLIDDICEDCGRSAGGASLVERFAANWKNTLAAVRIVSNSKLNENVQETDAHLIDGVDGSLGAEYSASAIRAQQERRSHAQTRALGAGFIAVPPLPKVDPDELILKDPSVPESKRLCGHCGMQFHFMKGFCPKCGREYSLVPTLNAGETIAGQYEIKGPIAFGGLGWVYLAWDKLLSRDVVLKGLLNSKDEISAAAALQERRYLAAVKHPNIVGIYNFVSHGREGFIVMEFISGKTLKQIRQERGPLPVAEAIAYVHRILAAFTHLHHMGMIYCDFKPDNFMLEADDVKLIDMGGVRRNDEQGGEIYCTAGYAAPESTEQPSVVSDLYTIARTLAVLTFNFKFQGEFEFSLPTPAQDPFLAEHESLYRFLLKATRKDSKQRFQSAEAMAQQLIGVLAEEAPEDYSRSAIESSFFETHDPNVESDALTIETVPNGATACRLLAPLRIDLSDSAADEMVRTIAIKEPTRLQRMLDSIVVHHPDSIEARLRLAEVRAQLNIPSLADSLLSDLEKAHGDDWRVHWCRGKIALLLGRIPEAQKRFDYVYSELPGELMPKLALAMCAESVCEDSIQSNIQLALNNFASAKRCYKVISKTDHTISPAIFGLARCMLREKKRGGAVEALRKIPPTSNQYHNAQAAAVRALIVPMAGLPTQKEHLVQAGTIIEVMAIEGYEKHRLCADLLLTAIRVAEAPGFQAEQEMILNTPLWPYRLREAAEKHLRICACFVQSERQRCRLVDEANNVRMVTFF